MNGPKKWIQFFLLWLYWISSGSTRTVHSKLACSNWPTRKRNLAMKRFKWYFRQLDYNIILIGSQKFMIMHFNRLELLSSISAPYLQLCLANLEKVRISKPGITDIKEHWKLASQASNNWSTSCNIYLTCVFTRAAVIRPQYSKNHENNYS